MKNYYFLILLLFLGLSVTAQIVTIPDANFKAKLLSADVTNEIAKDANGDNIKIDANNNGEIEISEALVVHKLFYTDNGAPPFKMAAVQTIDPISDLTGIAAFVNLEYLHLGNNELVSIDLSSNTMLRNLYCGSNLLTSMNLSGLVNLTYLNIRNNNFTSFSTDGLPALINFDCSSNPLLQTLTFNNNPALQSVDCRACQLTTLDVSGLSGLKSLQCAVNSINSLNLGSINQLTHLGCSSNQLAILDISNLNQLKELNCNNNMLTTNFDFSGLPEIISVGCEYNLITSLLFSNNSHLTAVVCNHNNLSSLDFSSTSIYQLYANDNPNLSFVNVKNGVVTPDVYVSQFPEPPFTSDNFQLQNTALLYICHDEGEFGPVLVSNEGLESISKGSYCSFTPGGNYNTITGNITFDCGGINTPMVNQAMNVTSNLQSGLTFTNGNGLYRFYSDGNTVTVAPQFLSPDYFTTTPANYTFNFADFGNAETADFCVTANGVHPDLEVTILPITDARPGFDAKYKIVYANKGNQVQSGSVTLSFDDAVLDFVSAVPSVSSQVINNLTWDFTNLIPSERREIEITLNINAPTETPAVNIGDTLTYQAFITTAQTDETPADNQVFFHQTVLGSFDPNDKEVLEGSVIDIDQIDGYLHYIIRFQNTGTAEAENIVIKDVLDAKLDWSTLQMVSSSHAYRSTLTSGNKLEVFYEGINLPASSVNEAASHGYIAFKIKPKNTVMIFDVIPNFASIYFDFNFPIITNTVNTTINALGIPSFSNELFRLYPNPTTAILNISVSDNSIIKKVVVINTLGQIVMRSTEKVIDVSLLTSGTYFVTVETDAGKGTQKLIKL